MSLHSQIARYAAGNNVGKPARLGQRYSETRFLPEAGNTVVCHLDRDVPAHRAVLDARARIQRLPGAETLLFTPPESLHMTVFEGVIETKRTADAWPEGLDRNASVADVTEVLLDRLRSFSPPPAFEVRLASLHPGGLLLTGATPQDERRMRDWREALTEPFGFRHETHEAYRFHMTFAYPTGWIPDELVPLWVKELQAISDDLARDAPVIPLRPPAFCQFADMEAFEPLYGLAPSD